VASELPDAAEHADRDRAEVGHPHSPDSLPTPPLKFTVGGRLSREGLGTTASNRDAILIG